MKGFINIMVSKRRVLIALHSIAGVTERTGEKGTTLSLNTPLFVGSEGTTIHTDYSFAEMMQLIEAVQ